MALPSLGRRIITGSYQNKFHIHDAASQNVVTLEANKQAIQRRPSLRGKFGLQRQKEAAPTDPIDCTKKILHHSYNPYLDVLAVAGCKSLYIFSAC